MASDLTDEWIDIATVRGDLEGIPHAPPIKWWMLAPEGRIARRKAVNLFAAMEEFRMKRVSLASRAAICNIELTNHCNLRCSLCPTGKPITEPRGYMDFALFRDLVDQVATHALTLSLINWGESTLHPRFLDCVAYAADKGLSVFTSSNLSLRFRDGFFTDLVAAGLAGLHVDIDGMSNETYQIYRQGGNLEFVRENLRQFAEANCDRRVKLEVAMIAMRHNEHEIPAFRKYCDELGVDNCVVGRLQLNPNASLDWLPEDPELRYQNYLEDCPAPDCTRVYYHLVINWDGSVPPCCLTYGHSANIGDATKDSLSEIWNNHSFRSIRSLFKGEESETKTICNICRNQLGSKNVPHYLDTFAISLD